jgi:hypothetical protein
MAAGTTVDNVLAGSQWEFAPYDAKYEYAVITDATTGEVLADVYSGQDILMEAGFIEGPNRSPVYPDDFTLVDAVGMGERIKVRLRNTGAGAHVVWTSVVITQL